MLVDAEWDEGRSTSWLTGRGCDLRDRRGERVAVCRRDVVETTGFRVLICLIEGLFSSKKAWLRTITHVSTAFAVRLLARLAEGLMALLDTLQIALGAGLATTFDDNLYLTGFFGESSRTFRPLHVVVGELLGFTFLLSISLLGVPLGLVIPSQKVGLLGLMPILIGLMNLLSYRNQRVGGHRRSSESPLPLRRSHHFESGRTTVWEVLRQKQTYDVFLVAISSGGNNLSIYIPLFASLSFVDVLVVVPVLYGYIAAWLFLSFFLTRAPGLALVLNRYAPLFFPFILIWLGCRILVDTGAVALLFS